MNAIEVHELVKRFGSKTVVDHVSMNVAEGEIVGFLGPNGSGKTTTIRIMCGLLTPDEGEGTVLGFNIRKVDVDDLPGLQLAGIALRPRLDQKHQLLPVLERIDHRRREFGIGRDIADARLQPRPATVAMDIELGADLDG